MKKFVTLLAGIVLAASLTTMALAQAAGPAGGGVQSTGKDPVVGKQKGNHGGPIGPKLLQQLNLTPDQQKQIKSLMQAFVQKRNQLRQGGAKPNPKELGMLRKQFFMDLGTILTPEQRDKLKQLMEQQRNKRNLPPPIPTPGTAGGTKTGGGL